MAEEKGHYTPTSFRTCRARSSDFHIMDQGQNDAQKSTQAAACHNGAQIGPMTPNQEKHKDIPQH